ncbi:hypothetical protein AB1N83_008817 [Pleurotus pulmonarius]
MNYLSVLRQSTLIVLINSGWLQTEICPQLELPQLRIMASPSIQELEKLAVIIVEHQRLEIYVILSSTTVLVYDYILTFDKEVSLIWFYQSTWSWTSILFMLNRYLPFFDTFDSLWHNLMPGITPDACSKAYQAVCWLYILGIGVTEVVLTIRTWAIWRRSRKLAIFLSVFFVVVWGPAFAVLGVFINTIKFGPAPYPGFNGCNVIGASQILFVVWVLLIVYEAGILALMAYRGYIGYRDGGNTALFNAVYRDGILYYLYLFALSLVNITVIKMFPQDVILLAS